MKLPWKNIIECILIIIIGFFLSFLIRTYLIDPRVVPTGSMLPTIHEKDRLLVDKLMFKFDELARGDIVVFNAPPASGETYDLVKRIIGLPGEQLEIKDGQVWINGAALKEDYLLDKPDYQLGPVIVPDDSFFVLGDNRCNSNDSHIWGFLPKDSITGRVWIRYWPSGHFGPLNKV